MKSNQFITQLFALIFAVLLFVVIIKNYNVLGTYYKNSGKNVSSDDHYQLNVPKNTTVKSESKKTKKKEKKLTKHEKLILSYQKADAYSIVDANSLSKKDIQKLFTISKISDDTFKRMKGKSYKDNCTIPKSNLRYIRLLHNDGHNNTRIGELVVNKSIAKTIRAIFLDLYEHQYPIEKMVLVDEYNADDNASMADNNSSSFNYRVVEGSNKLSKHSLGLAIDINPKYNPYIHALNGKTVCSPENGAEYADRTKSFDYKIDEKDYSYQLFTKYGFTWGGNWNSVKDYQHYEHN